jgi:molecular chaperone Hsp33
MSQSSNLLLPFQFHNLPVRGRWLRLNNLAQHVPSLAEPTACTQTLAEMLTAAAMLAHDTKHTLAVSLQLQHPKLGVLMFAHCGLKGELKAYANPQAQGTPFSSLSTQPGGIFAVTLEPENIENRYQSLIPLTGASAAECLAYYFQHSVQTPTLFVVFANTQKAAALMLQALPSAAAEQPLADDDWTRLGLILQTLQAPEALDDTLTAETLLSRLFAEDDLSLFTPEEPHFEADDPRPRMLAALAGLPAAEVAELVAQGKVVITDKATGQSVTFTAAELAHLTDTPTEN